jgi:hypothetical protein
MANSNKSIVITPNTGSTTADPKIVFSGADASTAAQNITMTVYPANNGTLSIDGSAGQLFSVSNSLTGTLFSVNDISGVPSIEVLDTGVVKLAQYNGVVYIGTGVNAGGGTSPLVVGNTGSNYSTVLVGDQMTVANNTGMYLRTTGVGMLSVGAGGALAFGKAGGTTEWARFDANGNFIIGNTSANGNKFYVQSAYTDAYDGATQSSLSAFTVKGTVSQFHNATGSTSRITRGNIIDFTVQDTNGADGAYFGAIGANTGTAGAAAFVWGRRTGVSAWSETMRIDSSGNLMIGQSTSGLSNSNSYFYSPTSFWGGYNHVSGLSTGTAYLYFSYAGTSIGAVVRNTNTTVSYNTSSDVRLKKNIVPALSATEKVKALQVRSFDWIADDNHVDHGFVAQELQTVEPLAVTEGEIWAIDPSKLVATLTKALQEALARIEALEAKLA